MNKEDVEKVKEDLERLKSMSPEDAMEIVKTYHTTFIKKMSENIDSLKQIQTLCPSMIPVTKTAMIVAERDFLDDRVTQMKDEGLKLCAKTGSPENNLSKRFGILFQMFSKACAKRKATLKTKTFSPARGDCGVCMVIDDMTEVNVKERMPTLYSAIELAIIRV